MRKSTPLTILIALISINVLAILTDLCISNKEICQDSAFEAQTFAGNQTLPPSQISPNIAKELASPYFALHNSPTKFILPDLRSQISFYGSLLRPDCTEESPLLHLNLKGESEQIFIRANTPLYLKFDQSKNQWKRVDKSPLKLTLKPKEKALDIAVELVMPSGPSIQEPGHLANFTVTETPPPTAKTAEEWSVGELPVDAHLLEKMNMKWCGKDAFLDSLSSDENKKDLQRIIVNAAHGSYTLWAKEGDAFIFTDNSWKPVQVGPKSQGKILLYVKSIVNNTMNFEIWKAEGSAMMPLSLNKQASTKSGPPPSINLIGARSKDTWVASIDSQRILLKTDDWLLCSNGAIEKIEHPEQLEAYLNGEKEGTLLAFSGIERVGSERSLTGTMIDSSRTESVPLSVSLFHSWNQQEKASPIATKLIAKNGGGGHGGGHGRNHGRSDRHHDDDDDDGSYDDDDDYDEDDEDYSYDD